MSSCVITIRAVATRRVLLNPSERKGRRILHEN
jgi:hypothetical protein